MMFPAATPMHEQDTTDVVDAEVVYEDTPERAAEREFWQRGLAPLPDFSDMRTLPESPLEF